MSCYSFCPQIDLFVKGRIAPDDAARQKATVIEILRRLESQPGLVLADEVGMGKTFVALAVAVSVIAADRQGRPVVVMVPPSLKKKWPRDFELFRERCLPPELRETIRSASADHAIQFLKLLDDPPGRKRSLLLVTHGAMSRGLTDRWVKLALIQRSLKGRHNTGPLRSALDRVMGGLIRSASERLDGQGFWKTLLATDPSGWLRILQRQGIDPEADDDRATDDDPVPRLVVEVLNTFRAEETEAIYHALSAIPRRHSKNIAHRVKAARDAVQDQLKPLWSSCLNRVKERLKLPLLILDEAHHLKNPETRLSSLFQDEQAEADAHQLGSGSLAGVFERMLFLTATPFQLGHQELCSVLDRFVGIAWPSGGMESYQERMKDLRAALDRAQASAVALDDAWGKLRQADLTVDGSAYTSSEEWWTAAVRGNALSSAAREVVFRYHSVRQDLAAAQELLRPWVIRHLKHKRLPAPHHSVERRRRLAGDCHGRGSGIALAGEALLPFLLAARASFQAPESRPVFAEGLASSYEAFLDTRRRALTRVGPALDYDDDPVEQCKDDTRSSWHLRQLEALLPRGDWRVSASHPKVDSTLRRVLELWRSGEKVVVFCHYIATGRVLRQVVSNAIREEIHGLASKRLECSPGQAANQLERIGRRFFDTDSPVRRALDETVSTIVQRFPALRSRTEQIADIVRRNFRTPGFLVRFFPVENRELDRQAVAAAMERTDESGLSLQALIEAFLDFLERYCGEDERERYLAVLDKIQVGSHVAKDAHSSYSPEEIAEDSPETLLPNVRLVNGQTRSETRQSLMLAFNTPFYPEVLIASSVLAEGVDLHLNCRHIIHHDLCWNPSTLEQRTGRVDRIGAKAEKCGKSILVALPFIAETQDEKMYRVVMDRERWFQVVMGEDYRLDLQSTEQLAERVPFPESAARVLAFKLDLGCDFVVQDPAMLPSQRN